MFCTNNRNIIVGVLLGLPCHLSDRMQGNSFLRVELICLWRLLLPWTTWTTWPTCPHWTTFPQVHLGASGPGQVVQGKPIIFTCCISGLSGPSGPGKKWSSGGKLSSKNTFYVLMTSLVLATRRISLIFRLRTFAHRARMSHYI